MPAPKVLGKAQLIEIKWNNKQEAYPVNAKKPVKVQFNPETLTVNFSNQKSGGDQRGGSAVQFVGQGTTTLSLDLWFDVTVPQSGGDGESVDDVRKLTGKVNYFIKPEKKGSGKDAKWIAPGVRFIWGTFLFDGIMDSMNEKLEYFSEDGKPLRAMVSIKLSSQTIQFEFGKPEPSETGGPSTPGTQPQQQAKDGDTMQDVAARAGRPEDWKAIAAANNIENPRLLTPGTLLNTNVGAQIGGGIGLGAAAGVGVGGQISGGIGLGASAGLRVGGQAGGRLGFKASAGTGVGGGISGGVGFRSSASVGASGQSGGKLGFVASAGLNSRR